jgi:NADH dehydrogenase FAD-containing subunit
MSKRVVLLGGGHAHVHVLQALAQAPLVGAEVLLVSPFARQIYSGMVPGLVAGHYTAEQCAIGLAPLTDAAQVLRAESAVVALNADDHSVTLADGRVAEYDVLSIDTGAVMDRNRLPGAREHALFVRPIEHFVALLPGLFEMARQRVLDIVVLGGGAAGIELALALQARFSQLGEEPSGSKAAGEVGDVGDVGDGGGVGGVGGVLDLAKTRQASPFSNVSNNKPSGERARVALVTGGSEPLAGLAPAAMRQVARVLAQRRITVIRDACVAVDAHAVRLQGGARLACDAAVVATGAEAPAWLRDSGLLLDDRGFVRTGPTLQSSSHPEVFAVGDVASRSDWPQPQALRNGVYAVRAGPPLVQNLRRFVAGGTLTPYTPQQRALCLLSCGDRSAIAAWGPWGLGGALWGGALWRLKERIDLGFVARYGGGAAAATSAPTAVKTATATATETASASATLDQATPNPINTLNTVGVASVQGFAGAAKSSAS